VKSLLESLTLNWAKASGGERLAGDTCAGAVCPGIWKDVK
jgi:hypothetical protein